MVFCPGRDLPQPEPVFEVSGIADPERALADGLERFDAAAALPPGRAVHHTSFGAGRVTQNDAENVLIDFARSKGHRMPIAADCSSIRAFRAVMVNLPPFGIASRAFTQRFKSTW